MVSLKIEVRKKDITWVVLLVAVLIISIAYAYGTSNPSVMGHSAGEIAGLGSLATKDSVSWSELSGIPGGFADGVDNEGSGSNRCFNAGRKCVADGTQINVETSRWPNRGCKAYAKVFGDEIKIQVDLSAYGRTTSSGWQSAYDFRVTGYEVYCDVAVIANGVQVTQWNNNGICNGCYDIAETKSTNW